MIVAIENTRLPDTTKQDLLCNALRSSVPTTFLDPIKVAADVSVDFGGDCNRLSPGRREAIRGEYWDVPFYTSAS